MSAICSRWRWGLLLGYGFVHAAFYVALLPLWEGYDEPFHYGYVQHLVDRQSWPVADVSPVSQEIVEAWRLVPVSPVWERKLPELTSFSEYFALPEAEQRRRRFAWETLSVALRDPSAGTNYEAQQPPLAYLALAPLDHLLRDTPLRTRVLVLRGFGALLAAAAYLAVFALLGRRMAIREEYVQSMAFCFFSLQNVWGSVAHIANDWLALPLIPVLLLTMERYWDSPGRNRAICMGAVLAAGLLAKSYFLIFVPAVVALGWRHGLWVAGVAGVVAGPWYWRNLELYGSISGLQEAVRPVSGAAMLATAAEMDWIGSLLGMARASLWTGNNSFITYSQATLNGYLVLLAVALVLWAGQRAGRITAGGTALFAVIPVYAMVLHGALNGQVAANGNPWHTAGLLPGVFVLAAAGCGEKPAIGRWVARGLCLLSFYLLATTYFVKLFPLYAGFAGAKGLASLQMLYRDGGAEVFSRLNRTALWGGGQLGWGAAVLIVYAGVFGWCLCRRLRTSEIVSPKATSAEASVNAAPQSTLGGRYTNCTV